MDGQIAHGDSTVLPQNVFREIFRERRIGIQPALRREHGTACGGKDFPDGSDVKTRFRRHRTFGSADALLPHCGDFSPRRPEHHSLNQSLFHLLPGFTDGIFKRSVHRFCMSFPLFAGLD